MKHVTRCVSENVINPSISKIEAEDSNDSFDNIDLLKTNIINCTGQNNYDSFKIEIPGIVNNKKMNLLLDTGASITVINNTDCYLKEIIHMEKNIILEAVNNTSLNIIGKSLVHIQIGEINIKHECIVVEGIC